MGVASTKASSRARTVHPPPRRAHPQREIVGKVAANRVAEGGRLVSVNPGHRKEKGFSHLAEERTLTRLVLICKIRPIILQQGFDRIIRV